MRTIHCKKTVPSLLYFLHLIALCPVIFLLGACTTINSKNINKINSDTYSISKKGEDSLAMRESLWEEADLFCMAKKKYFMPVGKNYNQTYYEMTFRCLNAGDPELLEGETPFQKKRYHKKLGGYGEVKY